MGLKEVEDVGLFVGYLRKWQMKSEGFRAPASGAAVRLPTFGNNKGIQNCYERQDITVATVSYHRINIGAVLPQVILEDVRQITLKN